MTAEETDDEQDVRMAAMELYGLPVSEFTARRAAAARAARLVGSPELAKRIARLPKPTVAAWAVNLLSRERANLLDDLGALGADLREAQEELRPDALRELTSSRRALVGALVRETTRLAGVRGGSLSASAAAELEPTLLAAIADATAERAIRSGLLVRGLVATGWDPVDLAGATAIAPSDGPTSASAPSGPTGDDDLSRRRELQRREREEAARRAADSAEEIENVALSALAAAERALSAAETERERLRDRRSALEAELEQLETEFGAATTSVSHLRAGRRAAEDALGEAREVAENARQTVRDAAAAAPAQEGV